MRAWPCPMDMPAFRFTALAICRPDRRAVWLTHVTYMAMAWVMAEAPGMAPLNGNGNLNDRFFSGPKPAFNADVCERKVNERLTAIRKALRSGA